MMPNHFSSPSSQVSFNLPETSLASGVQRNDLGPIMVVGVHYGLISEAEGICTWRLTHALRDAGIDTRVVTTGLREAPAEPWVEYRRTRTQDYRRAQTTIGYLTTGCATRHWEWVLRAPQTRTPGLLVYARAQPIASLLAGGRIASSRRIPLILHFSDPMPSPWGDPAHWKMRNLKRVIGQLLRQAHGFTFTTPEAMHYMERLYQFPFSSAATVIRNIAPDWPVLLNKEDPATKRILHIGEFYGMRKPDALILAMAEVNHDTGLELGLTVVGKFPFEDRDEQLKGLPSVPIETPGYTNDVLPHYHRAFITAVVDAEDAEPLYLATKAGEAMLASPRVLFITPPGSPARAAFDAGFRSVAFSSHDPREVAASIRRLITVDSDTVAAEMPARHERLLPFGSRAVAAAFAQYAETCISRFGQRRPSK
jgi:hypothetical protein